VTGFDGGHDVGGLDVTVGVAGVDILDSVDNAVAGGIVDGAIAVACVHRIHGE